MSFDTTDARAKDRRIAQDARAALRDMELARTFLVRARDLVEGLGVPRQAAVLQDAVQDVQDTMGTVGFLFDYHVQKVW